MKKGAIGLGITSAVFLAIFVTLFLLIPVVVSGFDMSPIYEGIKSQIGIEFNFATTSSTRLIFMLILFGGALLIILQLIMLIVGKRPSGIIFTIYFALCVASSLFIYVWHSDVSLSYDYASGALTAAGKESWLLLLQVLLIVALVFAVITYILDFALSVSKIKARKVQKNIIPVETETLLVKEGVPDIENVAQENISDKAPEEKIVEPVPPVEAAPTVAAMPTPAPTPVVAPVVAPIPDVVSAQPSETIVAPQPVIAPVFMEQKVEEPKKVEPAEEKISNHFDPLINDIMAIMNGELSGVEEPTFEKNNIHVEKAEIPTLVQVGPSLDEIRSVIKEENQNVKPTTINVDAELIRLIVHEELEKMNVLQQTIAPHVESAPVPETIPVEKPRVGIVTPFGPRAKEEKVEAVNPNKIIRIPFQTRMLKAEKDMKTNYNILKNEIMSYGVKSRVSNSGDTFRLHTKTYVKLTIAGKSLKLYFALNPKDYVNSKLPILDAGAKGIYKEIPLVFKVKSELSVRRAKQLIADVMEKDSLEQGKLVEENWVNALKDMKIEKED